MKNAKKRAITDLNARNGSRAIPFPSQEFGQDGHPKHDVTDAMLQNKEKMKVEYISSLLFDLFKTLHAIRN